MLNFVHVISSKKLIALDSSEKNQVWAKESWGLVLQSSIFG